MLLSAIVQMKNSLMKSLEHEAKEINPELKMWTQMPIIEGHFGVNPEVAFNPYLQAGHNLEDEEDDDNLILYTPKDYQNEQQELMTPLQAARENINLMYLYDDSAYLDFLIQTLKCKGVRIVEFPTIYDASSIVPFLLINDHSIIVVRNPKKDILPLIKLIMRKGLIFVKSNNQPIHINITLWVMIDAMPYIEKGVRGASEKKPPKKLQELVLKEYGIDFHSLFDIVIDISQYSNVDILGTDYLKFQDNLMLDRFSQHLDQNIIELSSSRKVFDFKELKCHCKR